MEQESESRKEIDAVREEAAGNLGESDGSETNRGTENSKSIS